MDMSDRRAIASGLIAIEKSAGEEGQPWRQPCDKEKASDKNTFHRHAQSWHSFVRCYIINLQIWVKHPSEIQENCFSHDF